MRWRCWSFAVVLLLGTRLLAQTTAPTLYMGREIAQTMHYSGAEWLTRESREREEDCTTMLKALHVGSGDCVCDLGCGNGFYSLKLATIVGDKGKVLAVDIQPEMLAMLKDRAKDGHITNVETILGSETDPKLPAAAVDLVLMVDTYHELSDPAAVLSKVKAALKPDGRLALVEFRAEDEKVPIKPLHKMSKAQIHKEMEANGLVVVEEFDKLPWQHLVILKKREPGAASPSLKVLHDQ